MARGIRLGPGNPVEQWLHAYHNGDVNQHKELDAWRKGPYGWIERAPKAGEYLTYVKLLANQWPHLELLADFMDVGTTPLRWNPKVPGGYPADKTTRELMKNQRYGKTNVCVLEYPKQKGAVVKTQINQASSLKEYLSGPRDDPNVKLRLFVVEDLSREVIETLGANFDIDPSFFREHLVDYVWYNIKDWWRDPPNLDIVSRGQNWFQMRFIRARYFKDDDSFRKGDIEAQKFNVFRRLEDDHNQSKLWDKTADGKAESRIGLIRSRVTFWVKPKEKDNDTRVGILLLDPTISEGHPMWRKYRNWVRPPPMRMPLPKEGPPPGESCFEDFIYWACRPDVFDFAGSGNSSSDICVPTQALLHLVCSEWLTMIDYIKTRLNQVDWEIAFPWDFLSKDDQIDRALTKLHQWRRVVPVYREMLADTFLRVFRETAHPTKMHPTHDPREMTPSALDRLMDTPCINAYKQDFSLALQYMEEYQSRIDRLTNVVTAVINMQDSRRGYKDNRNLQWLTWLATFFIPLSFVATMLSMSTDPYQLGESAKLWAEVSLPSGLFILSIIVLMSIAKCRRSIRKFFNESIWLTWLTWLRRTSSKPKEG
ncbi:hypothetical protein VMCG_03177 [Cytospora schulzeri]|uniref:Uncharacterized protein n=1 Tax=Cytospora schulzeri TaxID=448051 RepID=A0A423WXN5_9PEZI|nr:hypothetical protein VMCG_03177 [Valsa malicola]